MVRALPWLILLSVLIGTGCALSGESPEAVAKRYVAAVYARDYESAYELVSQEDRRAKSKEGYLQEHAPTQGLASEVGRKLASFIEHSRAETQQQGDRATVVLYFRAPFGGAVPILAPVSSQESAFEPSEETRTRLLQELERMHEQGTLPMSELAPTLILLREHGTWRVRLGWAEEMLISVSTEVRGSLPWDFVPLQETARVRPGDTFRLVYRVKNRAADFVTGRVREEFTPEKGRDFLAVMECFCSSETTLGPEEEKELSAVFRVASELPSELRALKIHYEFSLSASIKQD